MSSCFTAHRAWWSARDPELQVTLLTHLSLNRMAQLRAQCATWGGPLAAVVYVPIAAPPGSERSRAALANATNVVQTWFASTESARSGCQPRVLLLAEHFDSDRSAALLYPVNSLRNVARLMADTPLVANIDVDMLPSASLTADLATDASIRGIIDGAVNQGRVYVLPALETSCGGPSYADKAVLVPKDQLSPMIVEGCLTQFRERVAPQCHNATDFKRWFRADVAYEVKYATDFEPWLIGGRFNTVWFDFRYRGYGKNKISMVAATAASGARFTVHPSGFIVHRAHTESKSRQAFLAVKFKSRRDAGMLTGSLYQHIEGLWNASQPALRAGKADPVLEPAVARCLAALPWWTKTR
ncbi:hypothetical protein FOA52_012556 [Chlamydomonas sp. UWO 241]|nr:hypothetical protein FOA52_012556 [Chlamydomonas sp. UWO 241]